METEHPEIGKTLNSLKGIKRAQANPILYEKILKGFETAEARIVSMPPVQRWSIAAGLALLIALNVYSLKQYPAAKTKSTDPFLKEYFSYLENQF